MQLFFDALEGISAVIWHDYVLYTVLAVGLLFTVWSFFGQYRALTHGIQVIRGKYDDKDDPGAINHFQALSAALSATVGLGNIGGVALAIALGGPGAIFWMWLVGVLGMALKMTEVSLAMLDRNTDDPDNPHGGPMWVAQKGFERLGFKGVGTVIGGIFCVTLLVSTATGGNMFQSWNVADITNTYFAVPQQVTGIILAVIVGMVIIGGIKRIGNVAGRLVPLMCALYLLAALVVLSANLGAIPDMLRLIVVSAFNPAEAGGAFLGGTAAFAFAKGMQRALFSSEAGQGSSPIAHSAAKTDEPIREGIVAGLEPFIDTIVVCTITALVILSSGVWNRPADFEIPEGFALTPTVDGTDGSGPVTWRLDNTPVDGPDGGVTKVFAVVAGAENLETGSDLHRLQGTVIPDEDAESGYVVTWETITQPAGITPRILRDNGTGAYFAWDGATMTAKAFDATVPGLGQYLVTLAAWLFAISTMISWSYYGEQGIVFLFGEKLVLPYKLVYCLLIIVAATPAFIGRVDELDALTTLGTGVMLWANIPIMLIFGARAMNAYRQYNAKLKAGDFKTEERPPPPITDVVEGKDVE